MSREVLGLRAHHGRTRPGSTAAVCVPYYTYGCISISASAAMPCYLKSRTAVMRKAVRLYTEAHGICRGCDAKPKATGLVHGYVYVVGSAAGARPVWYESRNSEYGV